jgi:hypothetical protein
MLGHKIWGQYRFVQLLNTKYDLLTRIFGSEALLLSTEMNPERLRFALIRTLIKTGSVQSATLETVICLFDQQLWVQFCQTEKMKVQLAACGKTQQEYQEMLGFGQRMDNVIC